MICALTAIAFGMFPLGIMYKACEYRCPKEKSFYYYHYPKVLRLPPQVPCPPHLEMRYKT